MTLLGQPVALFHRALRQTYIRFFVTLALMVSMCSNGMPALSETKTVRSNTAVATQWTQTAVPGGSTVTALLASGGNLFAGTEGGGIFRSINSGATWKAVNNGLSNRDSDINVDNLTVGAFAVVGTTLFAGTHGGVFRSTDNGENWTAVNNGLGNQLNVIEGTDKLRAHNVRALAVIGTTVFAGTFRGGVFRTTDNGANWTAINNGLGNQLSAINFAYKTEVLSLAVIGTTLFAGTDRASGAGGVFRSVDNGANWTAVNNGLDKQDYGAIDALAVIGNTLFAGTSRGVFRSTDNGANWTAVNSGLGNQGVDSLAVIGTTLFAGMLDISGKQGGVFRTTDNGANWAAVNNGLGNQDVRSLIVIGNTLFAGTDGGVFRSTDRGANWTVFNEGLVNLKVSAFAVIGNNLFAGTDHRWVFVRQLQ